MEQVSSHKLVLRNLRKTDFEDIKEIMELVYSNLGGSWTKKEFNAQLKRFLDGQICIEDKGKVVAAAMSLIVDYSQYGDKHTYDEITGNGLLTTHDSEGDVLYGVDIFVHPDYQGMRLGRRLYDARKEICINLNLKAIIAGGRIPGYREYTDELTPMEYIQRVRNKEIFDPILTFQLNNDFHVKKVIRNYMPSDKESSSYATLLEWINLYYEEEEKLIGAPKSTARVGVVQWQMRRVKDLDDLMQQVEFFVDAVGSYNADIVLFPEFFNAPLMALFEAESPSEAVRLLSGYTEEIRSRISELAISYNVNIIAGSMPEYREHRLHNVSYLLRRDGTYDKQYKLHITPDEVSYWGLQGGRDLHVFDTDVGKIGILICYDVEFPELARILADQDMKILFVPYWTDTKNAYLRVRLCAQARAVENECYVVMTGSMGNLPRVENMDIQYSQSAVFSPSDIAFPHDAVIAEATPNTEMMLLADLDLSLLRELRTSGSVRNLANRRIDLYNVSWKISKKLLK
jgi:predicted amidohydrolase/ribosomal protein S18 acetylase RimI-like enzyme